MSTLQYFGTDGVRGLAGTHPMTASFALALGTATAELLRRRTGRAPHVVVGMDTRHSGPMLAQAATAGLASRGAHVTWLGVAPTPAVSYLTRSLGADAGLVVSASHNPFGDNGLKLFGASGAKFDVDDEAEVEALMSELASAGPDAFGNLTGADVGVIDFTDRGGAPSPLGAYSEHLLESAPYLEGLRVALDCANGAASFLAPQLFGKLGARLDSINVNPDGLNINLGCGSTHPEAITERVLSGGFDVGVTFDGDADRVLLIDSRGRLVTGDQMIAVSALVLGEQEVVATTMTNLGAEVYLRERGVTLHRVDVGDKFVYEGLAQRGLRLGGEQSGHVIYMDKSPSGDGILTALVVLAAVRRSGRSLEEWMDEIPTYPQTIVNVRAPQDVKHHLTGHPSVAGAVEREEEFLGSTGRVVVRPSGTEPLYRVMVEAEHEADMRAATERIVAAVEAAIKSGPTQ